MSLLCKNAISMRERAHSRMPVFVNERVGCTSKSRMFEIKTVVAISLIHRRLQYDHIDPSTTY